MRKDTLILEERSKSLIDSTKRELTHICELSRGSDSNLLKLQPTASIRSRIKRIFQKTIIVTGKHPATRFYLRSHAAIAFEKKRHGRSPNWWVIHPCSAVRFVWEIVMSLTYLYCFVVMPFIISFYMLPIAEYHPNESLLIPAYFVCLIDVLMNFITGHYARGYFLIDLMTSIPWSWILQESHTLPDGDGSNFATTVMELVPLLKLSRLTTLRVFLIQRMQALGIGHIARVVIWLVLSSALFCHWAACATYGFPFVVMHATNLPIETDDPWYPTLPKISSTVEHVFNVYLYSFYIGMTAFFAIDGSFETNVKYTLDADVLTREKSVSCIFLVFGMIHHMYLIIVVLQLMESEKAPEIRYHHIMNNLKFYVREKQLPPKMKKKLLNYYEYRFQDKYFKENVIVGSLADHLKDEILMHTCQKLMDRVGISWNLQKPLLGSIITALKPEIFLRNDVIFKCEDEGNCMYFIGRGTLAVITYAGKEICHLEDGAYFGESSLLYPGFKRPVTVIALEECELFRFDRKDFKRLIPASSDLYQRMRKVVKDQISVLVEIENEEFQNYESGESVSNIFSNVDSQEKTSSIDRR